MRHGPWTTCSSAASTKQQRPLRSHSSTVQLDAMSGNMMSSDVLHRDVGRGLDGSDGGASESTFEGAALQRLRVGGRARHRWNAPESADTIRTTAAPPRDAMPLRFGTY